MIFSFLIAITINRKSNKVSETAWNCFLKGAGILDEKKIPENEVTDLI